MNFQIPNVLIGPHEMTNEEVMNFFLEREKELVNGIDLFGGLRIRRVSKEDLEDLSSSLSLDPSPRCSIAFQ